MPTRFGKAVTQDWEPVVPRKPNPKTRDLRNPKTVNQALRSGAQILTVKKSDGGMNRKVGTTVDARKLESVEEAAAVGKVAAGVREKIRKARAEKRLTQAEVAKMINEPVKVVQEHENGKAIPNQGVLGKMEKVLGVKLRGLKTANK